MGLVESLTQKEQPTKCSMGRLLESLDKTESEALQTAIDNKMPRREIIFALQSNGYQMSADTFYAHRNKRCRCYL